MLNKYSTIYEFTVWKLRYFTATIFPQKFREIKYFTKELYSKLVWRKKFLRGSEFLVFPHCATWRIKAKNMTILIAAKTNQKFHLGALANFHRNNNVVFQCLLISMWQLALLFYFVTVSIRTNFYMYYLMTSVFRRSMPAAVCSSQCGKTRNFLSPKKYFVKSNI